MEPYIQDVLTAVFQVHGDACHLMGQSYHMLRAAVIGHLSLVVGNSSLVIAGPIICLAMQNRQ